MELLASGNDPVPSPAAELIDRLVTPRPDLLLVSPNPNPTLNLFSDPPPVPIAGGKPSEFKSDEEFEFGEENSIIDSDSDIDIDSDGSEGRVAKGSLAGSNSDSGRSSPLSVSSDSNEQLEDVNEWEGLGTISNLFVKELTVIYVLQVFKARSGLALLNLQKEGRRVSRRGPAGDLMAPPMI